MLNDLTAQNEKYILQKEKQLLKNLQNEHFSLYNYNHILKTSTNRAKSKDFPMKIINSPEKSVDSKEKMNISYISIENNKKLDFNKTETNKMTAENVLSLPKIPKYKSRQVNNHNYNQYTHINRQTTLEINKNEEETKKTSPSPKNNKDDLGNSNLVLKNLFDEQNFILKEYKDAAFRLIKERNEYLIEANRLKDIIDYKKIESVNILDRQNLNRSLLNDKEFVNYMNFHIDKRISNRLLVNNHNNVKDNNDNDNAYNCNRIRSVSEEVQRKFEGNKLKVIKNHGLYINSKVKSKEKSVNMTFFEKKPDFKIEKQVTPVHIPVYNNINTHVFYNKKTSIRDSSVKSLSNMMNIIINNSHSHNNTNDEKKVLNLTKSSNFNSLKSINTSKFHDLNKSNEHLITSQLTPISPISISKNPSEDKENKEIIQDNHDNHDNHDKKIYKKIKIIPISFKPLQINKLKDQRSIIKSDKSLDQSSNQSRTRRIINLNKEDEENEKEKKKISDEEYEKVMKLLNGIKQNVRIINKTEQDLNEINKTNKRRTVDVSGLYKKSNTIKNNKDLFNNSSNM